MKNLTKINISIHSMVIFRNILSNTVVKKFLNLLSSSDCDIVTKVSCYSEFLAELFSSTDNLTDYILNLVLEDENLYMLKKAQNISVSENIEKCLVEELKSLQELATVTSQDVKAILDYDGYCPEWTTKECNFLEIYQDRIKNISSHGYGIFAKYSTFVIKDGMITPVKSPDTTRLAELNGYKLERKQIIDNTLALINGKPAANALLYGDAGTGKSSSVKAVANEFADKGLRLIEITKKQLREIPALMDNLSKNPLKFILFIDDLSFTKDDDDFSALKAILEGSVSAKTGNLVVYATSNRRHLVKESFSDREGDDIHFNDTREELISLSARFGLTITFSKPDKKLYLDIVEDLAHQYELCIDIDDLFSQAEAYALR
ncbi:MAG: DUF815 domain-containing protein, partial [Oscillospiraceae bacterium]